MKRLCALLALTLCLLIGACSKPAPEATEKPAPEAAPEATPKAAPEAVVKPAPEAVVKPAPEAAVKPTPAPPAKPAPEAAVKPAPEAPTAPVVKGHRAPVVKAVTKAVPEGAYEVEASCGQCNFGLTEPPGCDLAVRIEGQAYYVDGSHLDDHGDAHARRGMCNVIRRAKVTGEVVDNRFVARSLRLVD